MGKIKEAIVNIWKILGEEDCPDTPEIDTLADSKLAEELRKSEDNIIKFEEAISSSSKAGKGKTNSVVEKVNVEQPKNVEKLNTKQKPVSEKERGA